MDFQSWIDNIRGLAGVYAFDILPDGTFSEIRLMAVNRQNSGILSAPGAPEFYPGIPYRYYWKDINFENYVYKCASTHKLLYSYVNARGFWLKGFYIPITEPGTVSALINLEEGRKNTVYCLYLLNYSPKAETDFMAQRSAEVSNAVMNISIKMHEKQDFYQAMAATVREIKKVCAAEKCSIYTVDKNKKTCAFINEEGSQQDILDDFAANMSRTPYEVAMAWEQDLEMSDCLLLEDLKVIEERDPPWYKSLCDFGIRNMILYEVRYNRELVGFIWAANYDTDKMLQIKETLELTTFLIAAVISNHQLLSRLEVMSTVDGLTQVGNRNAMNARVDSLMSGVIRQPVTMGVVFVDINGLKAVNDMEGHDAGDLLLTKAAALIRIAFGEHEIYRAGGDEFVIFCPDVLKEKFEQLVAQLRKLLVDTPDVSFAVGADWFDGDYDICKAMQAADEKMYADKQDYYRRYPEKDRRRRGR